MKEFLEMLAELPALLEANRVELEKVRQLINGSEPMTLKQSAAYLHVSYPTLKEYIAKGQITPSEYGSRIWVVRAELDSFIARNRCKRP